ncbi:peptidase G2 autoproteolytic cleavage domain-containing protein [Staphylococcus shinii]|uniref:peptidase G2 autoproteolytic cleavage domain-containing protein n=1 Tax=Staphylococcus shinii TaxID=2912228 RepID=UPI00298EEEB6|nr:peptidase G2 autoproteolytic cleavage domain-containing protein [Staphylococcus shinii]MDW8564718.1 peptidase G2 autoproteolytic cleavage domain-containing protein [Staphylococcus shinii]
MALNLIKKLQSIFGQKIINQIESNFEDIEQYADTNESYKKTHGSTEKNAHTTEQILHILEDGLKSTSSDELKYQRQQIKELVLGHNGNGISELTAARTSMDAKRFGTLDNRLYHDFLKEKNEREAADADLLAKIQRNVNVDDFGADPTGKVDSSEAFKKALGNGGVTVNLSAGTYLLDKGIKLPNYSRLVGQGQDISTIKLSTKAPRETIAITNLKMSGEAKCISVEHLAVNGNKTARFPNEQHEYNGATYYHPKPSGGSLSSNIRFAGVTKGFAKDVKSYDAILHCIDVTHASDTYYNKGDGQRVPEELESKYIWIENCETYGQGDDGITTHHSRYIFINNCYSYKPKAYHGNSNGIEVDDGSQKVYLEGNTTYHNHCGIEIKAHDDSSAPNGIYVNGHVSKDDARSYVLRHIGHHRSKTDDKSKTAYNVVLDNCMAITPFQNNVYHGWTPRALTVSAYRNVQVNNFIAIGDDRFTYGEPVCTIQFMAENIVYNNFNIMNFRNAGQDIRILGGDNRGRNYTISNSNFYRSSNKCAIQDGGRVYTTKVTGCNFTGNGTGTAIQGYNSKMQIYGVSCEGYAHAAKLNAEVYDYMPVRMNGGVTIGSTGSHANAKRAAVIASTGGSNAHEDRTFNIGSSRKTQAYGSRSGNIGSTNSQTIKGKHSQLILASKNVKSKNSFVTVGGYSEGTQASDKNIKYELSSFSGDLTLSGKLKQDNADIAELMESQSGQPIEMGMIVTLDGDKVRKAQQGDFPIGIISGTASLVSNDKSFHHKDRFLKDEYGVIVTETKEVLNYDKEGNEYPEYREIPVKNPNYIEDIEYKPRSERPEWNTVGMIGQIYTNVEKNVVAGDFISGRAGIGYKDYEKGRGIVMEVTTPYTEERGCAIALVLWGLDNGIRKVSAR